MKKTSFELVLRFRNDPDRIFRRLYRRGKKVRRA